MNIKRIEKPVLQQFLDESALLTGEGVVEYEKYIKNRMMVGLTKIESSMMDLF